MTDQIQTIKDRLLLDQALTPEQMQVLEQSRELQEFKDALDLAHFSPVGGDAMAGPEPNELIDARILGYAREQADRRRSSSFSLVSRLGIWHYMAGAMAACLALVVTYTVLTDQQPGATDGQTVADSQTPTEAPSVAAAGSRQSVALQPPLELNPTDTMSWDAVGLEQELFALQSAITLDLEQELSAAAVADMVEGS